MRELQEKLFVRSNAYQHISGFSQRHVPSKENDNSRKKRWNSSSINFLNPACLSKYFWLWFPLPFNTFALWKTKKWTTSNWLGNGGFINLSIYDMHLARLKQKFTQTKKNLIQSSSKILCTYMIRPNSSQNSVENCHRHSNHSTKIHSTYWTTWCIL